MGCALGCIILSFGLTRPKTNRSEFNLINLSSNHTCIFQESLTCFLDIPKHLAGEAVKGTAGPLVIFRNQQTHPGPG